MINESHGRLKVINDCVEDRRSYISSAERNDVFRSKISGPYPLNWSVTWKIENSLSNTYTNRTIWSKYLKF